jgi:glycosyltransferase involved in cell wall biosynthesis
MRIGFFIQSYTRGGVDTFIENLFSIQWKNDKIIIIYNDKNPGIHYLKKKLKKVTFLSYSIFTFEELINKKKLNIFLSYVFKILHSLFLPLTFIYQVKKTKFILEKLELDKLMIINGGYPGGDIALAAAIGWSKISNLNKAWINFHNFAVKKYNFFLTDVIKNFIDIIILKSVSGFVSVSKICSLSIKLRKNLQNANFLKVHNGHKLIKNTKNRIDLKKKLYLNNKSKILMMLAEYDLRKGHEFIIRCMEKIITKNKNVYLLIFGDGDKKIIHEMILKSTAKDNIILNNFCSDRIDLLSQADIVVIPSQKYESFGYVAIESMSKKKIVVATRCGGLVEVIENNKSGFLVKMKNVDAFVKKILFLFSNPNIKRKMENAAYKRYLKYFTEKQMISSYQNLIKYNKI